LTAGRTAIIASVLGICVLLAATTLAVRAAPAPPLFHTSDRCVACHNGLLTASGDDVSIGFDWRASIMANSSRDPYWQASVRRETLDHAQSAAAIEDECAVCHMPIVRYEAKDTDVAGVQRIGINSVITGDYANEMRFINALERSKTFFVINSVSLGGAENGAVRLELHIETFLRSAS